MPALIVTAVGRRGVFLVSRFEALRLRIRPEPREGSWSSREGTIIVPLLRGFMTFLMRIGMWALMT